MVINIFDLLLEKLKYLLFLRIALNVWETFIACAKMTIIPDGAAIPESGICFLWMIVKLLMC